MLDTWLMVHGSLLKAHGSWLRGAVPDLGGLPQAPAPDRPPLARSHETGEVRVMPLAELPEPTHGTPLEHHLPSDLRSAVRRLRRSGQRSFVGSGRRIVCPEVGESVEGLQYNQQYVARASEDYCRRPQGMWRNLSLAGPATKCKYAVVARFFGLRPGQRVLELGSACGLRAGTTSTVYQVLLGTWRSGLGVLDWQLPWGKASKLCVGVLLC